VAVELLRDADDARAQQDIKNAVDRITSFPLEAERPIVSLLTNRREVISLVIYGDHEDTVLRRIAEDLRDDLLQDPDILLVELRGVRPLEISIEVPQAVLRTYGLTLEDVAGQVQRGALDLPGGGVKTRGGEILLRTTERRDMGREFADLPVVSRSDGTVVRLGDIARIVDGFADTDESAMFYGLPAVQLVVYRIGEQTPVQVAEAVKNRVDRFNLRLPEGVQAAVYRDWSEIYQDRMDLLLRNARLGLVLVLLLLGLFLEVRVAFWVTLGIPIAILGSLVVLPLFDVSVNMISMFAFIITIGIVVDDAIVVGENVHEQRQRGRPYLEAAVLGARWIAWPVTFSVLSNMVAFLPLLFLPGSYGKIFGVVPVVVCAVFLMSLVECLFVLPAHLGHQRPSREGGRFSRLVRAQQGFARLFERAIRELYTPFLGVALRNRYLTIAAGLAVLLATIGYALGGHIRFTFFPRIESDRVSAGVVMPYGAPVEETLAVQARLVEAALEVLERYGGEEITRGIFSHVGSSSPMRAGSTGSAGVGHLANVQVNMVPSDLRPISADRFAREWREQVGDLVGPQSVTYQYSLMMGARGASGIDVELSHQDIETLERAAEELAASLRTYTGVSDIDAGVSLGKVQLDFRVKPEAQSLGITAAWLGRQVRNAFYGAEALRQQRGRDEVKVMVRLSAEERRSEYDVEELLMRSPGGGEIMLREAAYVERGRAYTEILRADGKRVINVTADAVPGVANEEEVLADLRRNVLPGLLAQYPGLTYSLEGQQRQMRETMESLRISFALALLVIFAMLAVAFRSYVQPLIVMAAIPFGAVGATLGHIIMGYDLSLMSILGIVALSGVVVNGALVLIHATNEKRRDGFSPVESITAAARRRFRPVVLTSLTTFFGLAPMIFETSMQARFLIPMAISLGYGILFVTAITLILVPAFYLVLEDAKRLGASAAARAGVGADAPAAAQE